MVYLIEIIGLKNGINRHSPCILPDIRPWWQYGQRPSEKEHVHWPKRWWPQFYPKLIGQNYQHLVPSSRSPLGRYFNLKRPFNYLSLFPAYFLFIYFYFLPLLLYFFHLLLYFFHFFCQKIRHAPARPTNSSSNTNPVLTW